jgi:hypothetical protein
LVTILALCIPLAFIAGGFVAYKGVQLGLRWQVEAKQEQLPTLNSPIQPIIEKAEQKQAEKQYEEIKSVFSEWTSGVDER